MFFDRNESENALNSRSVSRKQSCMMSRKMYFSVEILIIPGFPDLLLISSRIRHQFWNLWSLFLFVVLKMDIANFIICKGCNFSIVRYDWSGYRSPLKVY